MKKLMSILCIFLIGISLSTPINAAKLGGKLINGPRNITYTVNGGASIYSTNLRNGAYNWMYTGYDNPVYMTAVSSTAGSTVDVYAYTGSKTVIAYTTFWNSKNVQQAYTSNYWYCKIYFNDQFKNDYSINHDAVAAHEMGHVLGLNENNGNQYSIMCQAGAGRAVNRPQKVDSEEVVSMYGRY